MKMIDTGVEWLVDASGCDPERLRDIAPLRAIFDDVVRDLDLHPASEPLWRQFPPPGGVTGLVLLAESHLACHSFPELGYVAINLYCCRPRRRWPWEERLDKDLGAKRVVVREFLREPT